MSIEILRYAELEPMPWLNGGGVTHEIVRRSSAKDPDDFDWRVSIADVVQDGPFSTLPGIDRILVLCDGGRMILNVDGLSQELTRARPFIFAGESNVTCEVPSGPTQDLNVMTRRGSCVAKLDIVEILGSTTQQITMLGPHLLVVLHGEVRASGATSSQERRLQHFDSVSIENETDFVLGGAGLIASISIEPTAPGHRLEPVDSQGS